MKHVVTILFIMFFCSAGGCSQDTAIREHQDVVETPVSVPDGFLRGYRVAHYLELAVWLQGMSVEHRRDQLRLMAKDADFAPELVPLCRMLFEPAPGEKFRRPHIGGAVFVGKTTYDQWPLEPITIFQEVPILIVRNYQRMGEAETPEHYLEYCLQNCRYRAFRYSVHTDARISEAVSKFIEANPAYADDADWLHAQAP